MRRTLTRNEELVLTCLVEFRGEMKALEILAAIQRSDPTSAESPTSVRTAVRALENAGLVRSRKLHDCAFFCATPAAKTELSRAKRVRAAVRAKAREMRKIASLGQDL